MFEYFLTQMGEGSFVFQIEHQDDRITNYLKSINIFSASNGWRVCIDNEPGIDLDNKIIYLQGRDKTLDNKVDSFWGLGGKECKETMKAIANALKECVESAKAFKMRHPLTFANVVIVRQDICTPFISMLHSNPGYIIIR